MDSQELLFTEVNNEQAVNIQGGLRIRLPRPPFPRPPFPPLPWIFK